MTRHFLTALLLAILLAPSPIMAQDDATPTTPTESRADPNTVIEAVSAASPPSTLPGNVDETIELATWDEHYGEELAGTLGAWVLTGSPQLPIALLMVFESPESARAGIATYMQGTNQDSAGGLDVWTIADRGKWVCVTADGPVVLLGQAEPQPDESDDDVRERSCDVVVDMHAWLLDQLRADPSATPCACSRQ